jgi:sorbose reductase
MDGITDKIFVVTGGASGIGLATARRIVELGGTPMIVDLPGSDGAAVADELGSAFFPLDVTDVAAIEALAEAVETAHGLVAGVVVTAGISIATPAHDYTLDAWRRIMSVNLDGAFFTAQAFGKRMRGRGGSIVLISSIAASKVVSPERHAAYGASKAAITQLAALLGVEWAADGVRVNAIAPGYTNTPLLDRIREEDPSTYQNWVSQTPIGRLLEPREIANGILFYLSDLSSGCTASTLLVDGGYDKA